MTCLPKCLWINLILLGWLRRQGGTRYSLVHQTRRAQLDLIMTTATKHLVEAALMVVISVRFRRVDTADVDDNVGAIH